MSDNTPRPSTLLAMLFGCLLVVTAAAAADNIHRANELQRQLDHIRPLYARSMDVEARLREAQERVTQRAERARLANREAEDREKQCLSDLRELRSQRTLDRPVSLEEAPPP